MAGRAPPIGTERGVVDAPQVVRDLAEVQRRTEQRVAALAAA